MTMAPRIQVYTDIGCQPTVEISQTLPIHIPNPLNTTFETTLVPVAGSLRDCSSPSVQARAANIQASVLTITSVLSALTTGPWSHFGDLYGRKPLLYLTIVGSMATNLVIILIMDTTSIFSRYCEQFILLGPVLDGLLGGLSTFSGVVHAYTSDCTPHGSRSKIFSTLQGILFAGLSLGPWIGSFALDFPRVLVNANSVIFYLSITFQMATLGFSMFLLPESLRQGHNLATEQSYTPEIQEVRRKTIASRVHLYLRPFGTALLSPFMMFRPRAVGSRKDYNLTFLGLSLFIYLLSIGISQIEYLYGSHVYSWSATQLGFYMSLLWTTKAVNLLILLPIIIPYLKRKAQQARNSNEITDSEHIAAEMHFDKRLAQYSLGVNGLTNVLIIISPAASQTSFLVLSCLSSLTSGGSPAMHSLGTVCLHAQGLGSEVGSLFGGMAVLSAIAHTISPGLYALMYGMTVATFPKSIFCLAAGLLVVIVVLLGAIQPPEDDTTRHVEESG